jgi:chromosome partitioning protein
VNEAAASPSIRRLSQKPYVIAICHQKGGVGKSTSTAAIGAALADMGYRTLLIDLDVSANLTSGLGLSPENSTYSLIDVIREKTDLIRVVQSTAITNLLMLPANNRMITAAKYLQDTPQYEFFLRDVLNTKTNDAIDIVLFDCPPVVDELTVMVLSSTHLVIIPIQCEYYSLQALDTIFSLIRMVRERTNPQLSYRLLVTMFDQRGSFHQKVLDQARRHYDQAIFKTVIGFDTQVRKSQMAGVPITHFAPNTRAASQYRALAQELKDYVFRRNL